MWVAIVPSWAVQGQFSGWVIVPGGFDHDGFLDIVVVSGSRVQFYRNKGLPGHRKSAAVCIHAGLGQANRVDLRLQFPITGKVVELKDVKANTTVTAKKVEQ